MAILTEHTILWQHTSKATIQMLKSSKFQKYLFYNLSLIMYLSVEPCSDAILQLSPLVLSIIYDNYVYCFPVTA